MQVGLKTTKKQAVDIAVTLGRAALLSMPKGGQSNKSSSIDKSEAEVCSIHDTQCMHHGIPFTCYIAEELRRLSAKLALAYSLLARYWHLGNSAYRPSLPTSKNEHPTKLLVQEKV